MVCVNSTFYLTVAIFQVDVKISVNQIYSIIKTLFLKHTITTHKTKLASVIAIMPDFDIRHYIRIGRLLSGVQTALYSMFVQTKMALKLHHHLTYKQAPCVIFFDPSTQSISRRPPIHRTPRCPTLAVAHPRLPPMQEQDDASQFGNEVVKARSIGSPVATGVYPRRRRQLRKKKRRRRGPLYALILLLFILIKYKYACILIFNKNK